MPRPRHHPAAVAEVVLHNEPPAARSVAQLLSRADQVAASRRLRSGAQECRVLDAPLTACSRTGCCFGTPTAASPGLVGALLAETGAGSELRANAPAVAVPTATRAPVGGRRSPARRWWVRSVAPRRWADSPGAVEAARRADSSTRLAPDAGALGRSYDSAEERSVLGPARIPA